MVAGKGEPVRNKFLDHVQHPSGGLSGATRRACDPCAFMRMQLEHIHHSLAPAKHTYTRSVVHREGFLHGRGSSTADEGGYFLRTSPILIDILSPHAKVRTSNFFDGKRVREARPVGDHEMIEGDWTG